jgi:excisionase family DNA binding protein
MINPIEITKEAGRPAITFDQLPAAVSSLMAKMDLLLELNSRPKIEAPKKRLPINIDAASEILGVAKVTVYRLCSEGKVTSYKQGKKLYFYEDDLLEYVASGMRKSTREINAEVDNQIQKINFKNKASK